MTSETDFMEHTFAPVAIEGQNKNIPIILKGNLENKLIEVIDETDKEDVFIKDVHFTAVF